MLLLGIDTSCDDTSIAILEKTKNLPVLPDGSQTDRQDEIKVLSSVVSSQEKLHAKYGGVWPALAQREHQKNLVFVLEKAIEGAKLLLKLKIQIKNKKIKTITKILEREPLLKENLLKFLSKYQKPKIEAIAVTIGPGLEPCLWQGLNFAKALAFMWNIPIIPVNHLEGHLLSTLLKKENEPFAAAFSLSDYSKVFPVMGLIVSGGHTQLVLIEKIGDYKIIGQTLDDAAGECFDKTARILGLGYPGGPAIAAKAAEFKVQSSKFKVGLPRPMMASKDFDFSFSGLKTAVLYGWQKTPQQQKTDKAKTALAHEIQQAIIDVLLHKTIKAAATFKAKTILLCGGVSANKELRKQFSEKLKAEKPSLGLFTAGNGFFTDNGAMIALSGLCNLKKKQKFPFKGLMANGNLNL